MKSTVILVNLRLIIKASNRNTQDYLFSLVIVLYASKPSVMSDTVKDCLTNPLYLLLLYILSLGLDVDNTYHIAVCTRNMVHKLFPIGFLPIGFKLGRN